MLAAPEHWERYSPGSAAERYIARRYSYSDRMRSYWPDPQIDAAVQRLLHNLASNRSRSRCSARSCPTSTTVFLSSMLLPTRKALCWIGSRVCCEHVQACVTPFAARVGAGTHG